MWRKQLRPMATCDGTPDGDSLQRRRWEPSSQNTRVCTIFTHMCVHACTHTHRCAEGTDDDGAVWGGPMAPINGLITGHPQWHALPAGKKSRWKNLGNTEIRREIRIVSALYEPPCCCPVWEKFRMKRSGFRVVVFVCLTLNQERAAIATVTKCSATDRSSNRAVDKASEIPKFSSHRSWGLNSEFRPNKGGREQSAGCGQKGEILQRRPKWLPETLCTCEFIVNVIIVGNSSGWQPLLSSSLAISWSLSSWLSGQTPLVKAALHFRIWS